MYREPAVFVVDGDLAARDSVHELVRAMNLACRIYATGQEFLTACDPRQTGCVVLEVKLPDASGPQVQQSLLDHGVTLPVIFLTDHADVSLAVALMRAGAFHYLQKPLRPVELMDAVHAAIGLDRRRRRVQQSRQEIQQALASLSFAEREMLDMIAQGQSVAAMAEHLKLSLRAVELRRSKMMHKLRVKSSNGLLHFALLASAERARHNHPGRAGRLAPIFPDLRLVTAPGEAGFVQRYNGQLTPVAPGMPTATCRMTRAAAPAFPVTPFDKL